MLRLTVKTKQYTQSSFLEGSSEVCEHKWQFRGVTTKAAPAWMSMHTRSSKWRKSKVAPRAGSASLSHAINCNQLLPKSTCLQERPEYKALPVLVLGVGDQHDEKKARLLLRSIQKHFSIKLVEAAW